MTTERWIVIPRWDEFQHPDAARSKVLPWIKTWTRLNSDRDFLDLTYHQRGLLLSLWLEYARATRQLIGSTSALSRQLGQRVTTRDLETLNHAGFITLVASKPASTAQAHMQDQIESEKDKDLLTPGTNRSGERATRPTKGAAPRSTHATDDDPYHCPICGEGFRRLVPSLTGEWDDKFTLETHLIDNHNLQGDDTLDAALAKGAA